MQGKASHFICDLIVLNINVIEKNCSASTFVLILILISSSQLALLDPLIQRRTDLTSRRNYKAKYGGRFIVTMLPGDGIGPEMMSYVRTIFK